MQNSRAAASERARERTISRRGEVYNRGRDCVRVRKGGVAPRGASDVPFSLARFVSVGFSFFFVGCIDRGCVSGRVVVRVLEWDWMIFCCFWFF